MGFPSEGHRAAIRCDRGAFQVGSGFLGDGDAFAGDPVDAHQSHPQGRARAWSELERYGNDPQGYLDKIESEMQLSKRGRTA